MELCTAQSTNVVNHHPPQSNYFLNKLRALPGTSTGLTATIDEKYIHNGPGENSIRLYNIHVILVSALYSVYGADGG
jgi:hypothetical protein